MLRWSFSTMISSLVHCFLLCTTSLIAGATIKPTNAGPMKRTGTGNPTGKGPLPPVVVSKPPTKRPTSAPVPLPTNKPTNPARRPTRSPSETAAVLAALAPLFAEIGTNNLGCPNAAEDLRRGIFNTTKYQGKAAMFVFSLIQSKVATTSRSLVLYYALACIYHATGGQDWFDNTNWLSTTTPDPCLWFGVAGCDDNDQMVATSLGLQDNGLRGVVPCEIVLLSSDHPSKAGAFSAVSLGQNRALNTRGSAGTQWISGLGRSLEFLDISETSFGTRFPRNLRTKTPFLDVIAAGAAQVTGDLSFLVGLDPIVISFPDNNIQGTIPPAVLRGTNLRTFDVANNQLSGTLPTEIGNITIPFGNSVFFELRLEGNRLTGSIGSAIGNIPSAIFSRLYLFNNRLTGSVPIEYCSRVAQKIGVDCSTVALEVTCNNCPEKCCCTRSECNRFL